MAIQNHGKDTARYPERYGANGALQMYFKQAHKKWQRAHHAVSYWPPQKVTVPADILEVFSQFYIQFYYSSLLPDQSSSLLDEVALGWLSDVDSLLSLKLEATISSFPTGKAPGRDGIFIEFDK